MTLAFGAVAIAAAVVTYLQLATVVACIYVTAECGGTALLQCS
jgi:hypothetical protein